jgi:hypothetical protein
VERDLAQAATWYRKGADAGNGRAMAYLGGCYQHGHGVERDLAQAATWYRKGADAGNGRAMAYLGVCYEYGQGVERDLAQAATWYRKGADAGDERAAERWKALRAALEMLTDSVDADSSALEWAKRVSAGLNHVPWEDRPPLPGNWRDLSGEEAGEVLVRLMRASQWVLPSGDLVTWSIHRIRALPLVFYKRCALVDIQLQRSGRDFAELITALMAEDGGIALLDGRSELLHTLNPDLICLDDEAAAVAYLRFFCQFVRGEEGPFQVVESLGELAMKELGLSVLLPPDVAAIKPVQRMNDIDLVGDAWRFQGYVQYSDTVSRSVFKVSRGGKVDMEGDVCIAADLPVRRYRYDRFFRTPPRDV